jgi:hypothetical protein
MRLEEYGEALAFDVALSLVGVDNAQFPWQELGKLSLEASEKLRALAIITLLVQAEPDYFYHNLIRSGRARVAYLERLQKLGVAADHFRSSGWYEPMLDAIATGDWILARRIAALSPGDFQDGHEYEDDYCYAQLLHRFVQDSVPDAEIAPLLQRFEKYLGGQPSARLGLTRALAESQQADFEAAFAALLDDRDAAIALAKKRGQLEEPHVVAQRQVFVEGLALLRLAERRGLKTEPEYRYCPSLARVPMVAPFPGE